MIAELMKQVKINLADKPHRYQHVMGVLETAVAFGKQFDLDIEKLQQAALMHDMTKYYTFQQNKEIIRDNFENADNILKEYNEQILHGFSAMINAKQAYNITDEDVLNSILHHTIGAPKMGIYEKIIYLSDYIEPNRKYDSCQKVREIAKTNIDLAVYTAMDDTIKYHEAKQIKIPKLAYQARQYYKGLLEEQHGKN